MTQITKEAIEAMRPHIEKLKRCVRINDEMGRVVYGQTEAITALAEIFDNTEAALSTLPIAGEGKVTEEMVLAAAKAIAETPPEERFEDRDGETFLIRDLRPTAFAAIEAALSALSSSPGKDGGQEVEAEDRFGMKFVVNEQVPSGEVHIRDAGGSLLGKIVNAPAADWTCAARKQSLPEPADCDWPFCGCDPHADKVIAALQECGWSASPPISDVGAVKIVPIEPTSAMIDAANESEASWKSIWPAMLAAAPVPPSSLAWDGGQEVEAVKTVWQVADAIDPERSPDGGWRDQLLSEIHADLENRGRRDKDFAVTVHHRNIVISAVSKALRDLPSASEEQQP